MILWECYIAMQVISWESRLGKSAFSVLNSRLGCWEQVPKNGL
jgi:hypothetical protein